uniref:MULE transposase N-terminal all-beta domain-containing protein n=1 Tax=Brassica oleracea var. oleracea TaxID=109376 RepID=A0A0D3BZ24_BRAOL
MFPGIFRGTKFLGNFRGPRSSEIPDANSEEDFVGTSEDWTIGNFLGIYRGSPPSVYSEELSDDLVVLGVSSEIQFLGIPSEISEGFPRKNEFPRSYFRGFFSSDIIDGGDHLFGVTGYDVLLDMICKKMAIDQCKKRLNLSNIPLVVKPKRQSYILDDEDVFVYLTSVDKDQRRSIILHIEGITEVKKVPIIEKFPRTEKASSYGENYSELSSGLPKVEANPVVVILYNAIEKAEQHLEVQELRENVVIPYEQDVDARPLLTLGIRQKVHYGYEVTVWEDPWILKILVKPASYGHPKMTVTFFIQGEPKEWNLEILENLIFPEDIPLIQSFSLNQSTC